MMGELYPLSVLPDDPERVIPRTGARRGLGLSVRNY